MYMNEVFCCDDCFDAIAQKSSRAASLLLDLCDFYEPDVPLLIEDISENETLLNHIRILELNDCLISMDIDKNIHLRIKHIQYEDDGACFCKC